MKKLMSIACAALVLLTVGLTAGPANAEPLSAASSATTSVAVSEVMHSAPESLPATVLTPMTGNYEYNYVLTTGWSYMMAPGEVLTNCHGSYLQKYLDGRQLSSVNLTYGGVVATNPPVGWVWGTGCILALAGVVSLAVFPPSGTIEWMTASALAGFGIEASCLSF